MRIDLSDLLFALSAALDAAETSLLGVRTNHGKRVACLSCMIGRQEFHLTDEELVELAACAIMHDNALTEFISTELNDTIPPDFRFEGDAVIPHCEIGERNAKLMPFGDRTDQAILYHHENADGSGPFGMKEAETPLYAQLIHFADVTDAIFYLGDFGENKVSELERFYETYGSWFSTRITDAFRRMFPSFDFSVLRNDRLDGELRTLLPGQETELAGEALTNLGRIFARIADYKSHFTYTHSAGVAEKARRLGAYEGFSADACEKLFLAGALHDIGKLKVKSELLDKPGKLTAEEFEEIKQHAFWTWEILRHVRGFGDVLFTACRHHEKLDGSGYPFGVPGSYLTQEERMMACIDIYQALTEDRPYRKGMDHTEAMKVMEEMAKGGAIDRKLTQDVGQCFGEQAVTKDELVMNCANPQGEAGRQTIARMNESHAALTQWGLSHIEIAKTDKVLDVGCGGGAALERISSFNPEGMCYGIDISELSLAEAKKRNARAFSDGKMQFLQAGVSRLPFGDAVMDAVISVESYYFWPDPPEDLKEISRIIRKGGTLLLVLEYRADMEKDEDYEHNQTLLHMKIPDAAQLQQQFEEAGFDAVRTDIRGSWLCAAGKKR